jgi:hypothetical protein
MVRSLPFSVTVREMPAGVVIAQPSARVVVPSGGITTITCAARYAVAEKPSVAAIAATPAILSKPFIIFDLPKTGSRTCDPAHLVLNVSNGSTSEVAHLPFT